MRRDIRTTFGTVIPWWISFKSESGCRGLQFAKDQLNLPRPGLKRSAELMSKRDRAAADRFERARPLFNPWKSEHLLSA